MVCETVVWSLADWVKNLIEKKWPGLSDSDMVTSGLKDRITVQTAKIGQTMLKRGFVNLVKRIRL